MARPFDKPPLCCQTSWLMQVKKYTSSVPCNPELKPRVSHQFQVRVESQVWHISLERGSSLSPGLDCTSQSTVHPTEASLCPPSAGWCWNTNWLSWDECLLRLMKEHHTHNLHSQPEQSSTENTHSESGFLWHLLISLLETPQTIQTHSQTLTWIMNYFL